MARIKLIQAIFWGVLFGLAVVAVFWNPCHYITIAITGGYCLYHVSDWLKAKRYNNK